MSITIKLYLQRRTYINVEVKRDGLTLRGELVVPEKDSYDIAILMHGFTGNRNGELLTALADALLEKGVASVRLILTDMETATESWKI